MVLLGAPRPPGEQPGPWDIGPICYPILAAVALDAPISPVKGGQALWRLEEGTMQAVADALPGAEYREFPGAASALQPPPGGRAASPPRPPAAAIDTGSLDDDYATQLAIVLQDGASDSEDGASGSPSAPCTPPRSVAGGSESPRAATPASAGLRDTYHGIVLYQEGHNGPGSRLDPPTEDPLDPG
eukprot:5211568-Pyramimonas_sp.AAC.1